MSYLTPLLAMVLASAPLASAPQDAISVPDRMGYNPAFKYEHRHDIPQGDKLLYVETQLRCNCGCGLNLHLCQFQMQCGTSPVWSQRALRELQAGSSEDAVLAGFVSDFGEAVLMAPPAEGFNWLGYLLPPAALVLGGVLVGVFLRGRETAAADAPTQKLDPADWDRLQDELKALEEDTEW